MARVKQPFGEERFVPWIGRIVEPGETVEVPDGDLVNYLEAGWQPGQDKETKALVDALRKEQDQADEQQPQGETPAATGKES
ncbi:hypothetical protein [Micromonospora sp. RTP1Z1]|uniref:hypothetical protein n=1 Tax=Micromonospora sp. RTP1Z1 TaxID=2994043 RepID=UPI0029C70CE9|nr:hypothetical protein [Micromonospora sp. RTP1Z1]